MMTTFTFKSVQVLLVVIAACSSTTSAATVKNPKSSNKCPVELNYVIRGADYYWQCKDTSNTNSKTLGKIVFDECRTNNAAEECSKKFPAVKNANCVKEIKSPKNFDIKSWTKMQSTANRIPGVALCSIQGKSLAVEYFFSPGTNINPLPPIHFSWKEVNPADLLIMFPLDLNDLTKSVYNNKDTLKTICGVPKYGFLPKRTLIVVDSKGKWVLQENNFSEKKEFESWNRFTTNINLKNYAPGKYLVKCVGQAWSNKEKFEVGIPFEIKA